MSNDMGGPAFPQPMTADNEGNFHHTDEHPDRIGGLRVWDWYAGQVLAAGKTADFAAQVADAMLAERNKRLEQADD